MKTLPTLAAALALAALAPLGGCSKVDEDGGSAAKNGDVDRTLAAAIAGAPDLSRVASALSDAGLAGIFDGPGSYTLLAPSDQAFAALGDAEDELTSQEGKPVLVAILRDHILPGHLTPDAVRQAIEEQDGAVEMRTLGEGTVKFTLEGDTIAVVGDSGQRAKVVGSPLSASNGVVMPIDGLLKQPEPVAQ